MRSLIVAALAIGSFSFNVSNADNVTVRAEGVLSKFSDPDGLLPFSEPPSGSRFILSFTYDDETTDSTFSPEPDSFPGVGLYRNPIISLELQVEGQSFGLLDESLIIVTDDDDPEDGYFEAWDALTRNLTPTGIPNEFLFETILLDLSTFTPEGPISILESDDLIAPFGPAPWENANIYYYFQINNPFEPGRTLLAEARATVTSITVIPVPAAFWLLSTALGVFGWLQRRAIALVSAESPELTETQSGQQ